MPGPATRPHIRLNRLTGEWVLVSPQRTLRPWQGKEEAAEAVKPHDDSNPLRPGAVRNGVANPRYSVRESSAMIKF